MKGAMLSLVAIVLVLAGVILWGMSCDEGSSDVQPQKPTFACSQVDAQTKLCTSPLTEEEMKVLGVDGPISSVELVLVEGNGASVLIVGTVVDVDDRLMISPYVRTAFMQGRDQLEVVVYPGAVVSNHGVESPFPCTLYATLFYGATVGSMYSECGTLFAGWTYGINEDDEVLKNRVVELYNLAYGGATKTRGYKLRN